MSEFFRKCCGLYTETREPKNFPDDRCATTLLRLHGLKYAKCPENSALMARGFYLRKNRVHAVTRSEYRVCAETPKFRRWFALSAKENRISTPKLADLRLSSSELVQDEIMAIILNILNMRVGDKFIRQKLHRYQ